MGISRGVMRRAKATRYKKVQYPLLITIFMHFILWGAILLLGLIIYSVLSMILMAISG